MFPTFRIFVIFLALANSTGLAQTTDTDSKNPPPSTAAPRLGQPLILDVTLGLEVAAANGPCNRLKCSFPLPIDWPEQKIEVIAEQRSPQIKRVTSTVLEDGVRQARFFVSRLKRGETAATSMRLKVTRFSIRPPVDPSSLRIPKTVPAAMRRYLMASPFIETNSPIVVEAADQISLPDGATAWQMATAIRDYTHQAVVYSGVRALKGARAALEDKSGDCEERTSVFVALCRRRGIPARSVWIPLHAYAEFYLEDADGLGHWFPCESVGGEIGHMPNDFVILQKGDNFRDPLKTGRQRYITETATGTATRGGAAPLLKPIYELHEREANKNEPRNK